MTGPTYPVLLPQPWAQGGSHVGTVNALGVLTGGVLVSTSNSPYASLPDGFPSINMISPASGGVAPSGGDFNAILQYITAFQTWVNAGGQFNFNTELATLMGGYSQGAVVQLLSGAGSVISTINANSNAPDTNMTGWQYAYGLAVQFSTSLTPSAGTTGAVYFNTADGLTLQGKTGSTYDVTILTPNFALALGLLTGTNNWTTPGQFTATQFNGSGSGLTGIGGQIQPVTGTVASNALTLGLNPTTLTFRSSTLGSGAVTNLSNASALSLTVPSGATLGTVNGVQSTLAVLALNNAGTVVLGIVNLAGGVNLDETTLISTTAISAGATSASTVYSAAGLAAVPFRVVGYITSTQATAGTWASAPSLVQGEGGQAMAALQSMGNGQTYQNVGASRAFGTTYYNTTGRPIFVYVSLTNNNSIANIVINGAAVGIINCYGANTGGGFVVPPGSSYSVTYAGTLNTWFELR